MRNFLRRATARPEIISGPIATTILKLAIPAVLLNLLRAGYNIVDLFWLGKLGKEYLSGVSGSIFLVWGIHNLCLLVTIGIVAVIARNVGEGNTELACENGARSIRLAALLGIATTVATFPLIYPLIGMIGLEPTVYQAGVDYLEVTTAGTLFTFLMFAFHSILVAWGDTLSPLKIYLTTFLLNLALSPVLMFGLGPFPRLETRGTALATIFSYAVAAVWFFLILKKRGWIKAIVGTTITNITPYREYIKIGLPVAFAGMMFSFIYFFIAKITVTFGSEAVGAMGVGHKVESLAYFIALGFASGLASFTGQNIGAGRFDRVWKGTVISIKIIFVFTLIYSIATIVWAPELVMLFNNDPAIVHHGTDYIRIVLIAETLQAVLIILEDGAFSGAGFTRPSFTLSLPVILARIPLAWLLAIGLGMGATGVWLTIAITMAVNSLIFIRIMLKKGWMETAVA